MVTMSPQPWVTDMMEVAKSKYKIDEFILCLSLAIFFLSMIIGALNFAPSAQFFPLFLCVPGFVLTVLYIFRGWLSPGTVSLMAGSDGFLERSASSTSGRAADKKRGAEEQFSASKAYMLFGFTYAFMLTAFLVGFYLSILLSLSLYLYVNRTFNAQTFKGNIVLILFLLATVYVFDTAFGYHFNRGLLLSVP